MVDTGNNDAFYADVLRGIGAPVNAATLSFMHAWGRSEGSHRAWNPFNTMMPYGSTGPTIRLQSYGSRAEGLAATIKTLNQKYYVKVVQALRAASPQAAIQALVNSPWASGHYNARKTSTGGYNISTSTIYRVWAGITGGTTPAPTVPPAKTSYKLPLGIVSGSGLAGTVQYDPIKNVIIAAGGIIRSPKDWLSENDATTRKNTRVVIAPGAYQTLYNSLDPGRVTEERLTLPGFGVVGEGLDAGLGAAADIVAGPWEWIGSHMTAIGIGALGVLAIIAAVALKTGPQITQMGNAVLASKVPA